MNHKFSLILIFGFIFSFSAYSQMESYSKKIRLNGISEQWHAIPIPTAVYTDLNVDVSDIRVYGITETDTIEAPYILNIKKSQVVKRKIPFIKLNESSNDKGHFYTFQINNKTTINSINLNFENKNFDWKIQLEGSMDQNEWYTLLNDYRVLSLENQQTDYRFTDLKFKTSNYTYYRVTVKNSEKPVLNTASVHMRSSTKATYTTFPVKKFNVVQNDKFTILDIELKERVPVSFLSLKIVDTFDYYRPISIQYIADSVQTEKEIKYSYRNLQNGTLTSMEDNNFNFPSVLAKKIKVEIANFDNHPLEITDAIVKGYNHELVTRFTVPANYYLVYGKKKEKHPVYDISSITNNLPENMTPVTFGSIQDIPKKETKTNKPLFQNKWWLWAIMGIIAVTLGAFTLKMIKTKE